MKPIEKVLELIAKRESQYRESGSRGTYGNCDSKIATALRSLAVEAIAAASAPKPERTWEEAWKDEAALREQIPIGSKWRHKKRGTEYAIVELGMFQDATGSGEHDMELCVIYYSFARSSMCVRRAVEFLDGRFESVD